MKIVSHYGIHWADGEIAYLEQEKSGTNAVGLKEKSPFTVKHPKADKPCNHLIPLACPNPDPTHWSFFKGLTDNDQLVQAMLPIPKKDSGGYYIVDLDNSLKIAIVLLSKMSSPIATIVLPWSMLTFEQIIAELQMTNVQPLVLTGVTVADIPTLLQVNKRLDGLPRKLILTFGDDAVEPPSLERITTNLDKFDVVDLVRLPWETFGAVVVRKHMRREQY